ncbi:MAG: hypothetical protein AB7F32_05650 [Victivallaceae bacterium]
MILLVFFAVAAILILTIPKESGEVQRLAVIATSEENAQTKQKSPAANEYPFRPASAGAPALLEGGTVSFFHDRKHLRVLVEITDSDLVQESEADNQHHYRSGDVLEIFIRPAGFRCYWEIYVTPNEKITVFFYPSPGRRLPSCLQSKPLDGLSFEVELHGSLNDYQDRDKGWKCDVVIPFNSLEKQCGQKFDFSKPWEIQISRYNHSVYLDKKEYSQLGIARGNLDFHDFSSWALLTFDK